jgi:uncharacterized protein YchJ
VTAPELADPVQLSRTLLELARTVLDKDAPEIDSAALAQLVTTADELAAALEGKVRRFAELDARSGDELAECLFDLPRWLSERGAVDSALSVARAFAFVAPDAFRGEQALILARAERREEALALVATNLEQAEDIPTAEAKAGDVYRALGELDSAEAYYRRSLAEARTSLERTEAMTRLVALLCEVGREGDASDLLQREEERLKALSPAPVVRAAPKVGRNDACPCGSGKKYKKCHGAGG